MSLVPGPSEPGPQPAPGSASARSRPAAGARRRSWWGSGSAGHPPAHARARSEPAAPDRALDWARRQAQWAGPRARARVEQFGEAVRRTAASRRSPPVAPAPEPADQVAFVLAGGGSRGAVQVGMLVELVARGIRADRVYGASVGAINAAAYAGDPTPEGMRHVEEVWRGLTGDLVFPKARVHGPWLYFQQRPSVHPNSGLRKIIEDGVGFANLEDATVPLEVVTTSLTDGRERWIGQGPVVDAVLASAAIPAMFPPVTIDGDVLVDGGVVNNVPLSRAIEGGANRIYVLLCGPLHYHPREPRRPIEAVLTAFFVAVHARFARELASVPAGIEVVVFSGGGEPSSAYSDFSMTGELIAEGRAEVAEVLDRYRGTPHQAEVPGDPRPGRAVTSAAPVAPAPAAAPAAAAPASDPQRPDARPLPTDSSPGSPSPTPVSEAAHDSPVPGTHSAPVAPEALDGPNAAAGPAGAAPRSVDGRRVSPWARLWTPAASLRRATERHLPAPPALAPRSTADDPDTVPTGQPGH